MRKDVTDLSASSTDLQQTAIIRRRSALQLRIDAWCKFQDLYMPGVALLRSREATVSTRIINAEHLPLYLPSVLVDAGNITVSPELGQIELRLRHAQANDALEQMRRHLRARSRLYNVKDRDVRGQRYNTRARNYISTLQAKVDSDKAQYRLAYRALLALDPADTMKWQKVLRTLEDNDVRGMKEQLDGESEGTRRLPWIWRTTGFCGTEDEDEDELEGAMLALRYGWNVLMFFAAVRIEWCKARARAHRWSEECELLEEEMRRVIDFFDWQASWWRQKAEEATWDPSTLQKASSSQHNEGRRAYARRQAGIRLAMLQRCVESWKCVPEYLGCGAQLDE